MKEYAIYWTERNNTTGKLIFDEDERSLCERIAKDLSMSKLIKKVQIYEYKILETPSLKDKIGEK